MAAGGTEKLYWIDSDRTDFDLEGPITPARTKDGRPALVLPRTFFYPEGGGQLGDTGALTIDGLTVAVEDTQIDDDGVILHVLSEALNAKTTAAIDSELTKIHATIVRRRRREHMALHTAQHALSRALADIAKADTVSARLGATTATIDVSRPGVSDADLYRVEDLVDDLVSSNVTVRALYPNESELRALPLRKQPKVDQGEVVRIIDIEGFDMTPCGGTHCSRTGQIGQARFVAFEKYKGMLRISFVAGSRALADARAKHDALTKIAADLTCGVADVPGAISKLRASLKETRATLDTVREELLDHVARALTETTPEATQPFMVPVHRPTDDLTTLRALAGKVTAAAPRAVVIATGVSPGTGELLLVVQRGASAELDCGAFLQTEARTRGGRGGGRPERAEGRFPKEVTPESLRSALEQTLAR